MTRGTATKSAGKVPAAKSRSRKESAQLKSVVDSENGPRSKLLKAATEMFSRYGYDSVSTGEIAKLAGLSQSTVHYYFSSKLALWQEAFRELAKQRSATSFTTTALEYRDLDPLNYLKILVRRQVLGNLRAPNYFKFYVHEALGGGGERLNWLLESNIGEGLVVLRAAIDTAVAAGVIRNAKPDYLTYLIIATASVSVTFGPLAKALGHDFTAETGHELLLDSIVEALFNGMIVR